MSGHITRNFGWKVLASFGGMGPNTITCGRSFSLPALQLWIVFWLKVEGSHLSDLTDHLTIQVNHQLNQQKIKR